MARAKLKEKKSQIYSVEEYLQLDRASDERYEFVDGQVYLMAGESGNHGDISVNVAAELRQQLKGKDCRARAKDTKIKSGSFTQKEAGKTKGMFSYPDVVVICGEPQYHDKHKDIVLNPAVVLEVLSESTAEFDRTNKFARYRLFNPTLTDYILVSQDKPLVEHFVRQADDDGWKVFIYYGLKEILKIDSIECRVKLSEIYDRIEFSKKALAELDEITNNKY